MSNIRNTETGEFGLTSADMSSWFAQQGRAAMIAEDFEGELEQFESLVSNSDIILYRDGRGNKVYGQIFGDISTVPVKNNLKRHAISFAMTETAFIEKDLFRGDA